MKRPAESAIDPIEAEAVISHTKAVGDAERCEEETSSSRSGHVQAQGADAGAAAADSEADASVEKKWGTRYLTDADDVFEHNAWDNVDWDEEQEEMAKATVSRQTPMSQEQADKCQTEAAGFWDAFYSNHQDKFFKDRNWLRTAFPQLYPSEMASTPYTVFEAGCGVGNTVFPLLATCTDPRLFVHCCDFSATAIDILKSQDEYKTDRCRAFVYDLSSDDPFPDYMQPSTIDVIVTIYVLSAIVPEKLDSVLAKLAKLLKPGGYFLFRDYGLYDLVQLRFKKGRLLRGNLYARGDGTLVYFFTKDEIAQKFENAGLVVESTHVDRRLLINRGKKLKMYRVWLHLVARKPLSSEEKQEIVVPASTVQDSIKAIN